MGRGLSCRLDVKSCGTRIVVRTDHSLIRLMLKGRVGSGIDDENMEELLYG